MITTTLPPRPGPEARCYASVQVPANAVAAGAGAASAS